MFVLCIKVMHFKLVILPPVIHQTSSFLMYTLTHVVQKLCIKCEPLHLTHAIELDRKCRCN